MPKSLQVAALEGSQVSVNSVLELLTKEKFAHWYGEGGRFDAWLTGDNKSLSREDILQDLKKMLS